MKLEEIRKLCNAATPGPWCADDKEVCTKAEGIELQEIACTKWSHAPLQNAEFIAASRSLVPKLLAVAEAAAFDHTGEENCGKCGICVALAALEET